MTLKETIQILAILNVFYGQGKADPIEMSKAWHVILKDHDYTIAEQAVINFAKNDKREYATFPSAGQIVQAIKHEEKMPNLIYNLCRHGELYNMLPDRAKEMITMERYKELQKQKELFYDDEGYLQFVNHLKLPKPRLLKGEN